MKRWVIALLMLALTGLCVWMVLKKQVIIGVVVLLAGFEFLAFWYGERKT